MQRIESQQEKAISASLLAMALALVAAAGLGAMFGLVDGSEPAAQSEFAVR